MTISKTKKEKALATLAALRASDHEFLPPATVKKFNIGFGLSADAITPYAAVADRSPNNPKGLQFNDGRKVGHGYDAADYAEEVSAQLGTGFKPWQSGRGFRLRSACDAIAAHFNGECTAYYSTVKGFTFGPRPKCRLAAGHPGAHNFPGVDDDRRSA